MFRTVISDFSSTSYKTFGYATKAKNQKVPQNDIGPKIACVALSAIGATAFYVAAQRDIPREYQGPNNSQIDEDD